MGSSMVNIFLSVLFNSFKVAYKVVVFPEPVGAQITTDFPADKAAIA